ncbi:uncharacterized protein [Periplaneta americana]|uniref:uncharacterized protein n=1 Tax=Periplaneta americana TaxID=6978 RepID=UPI0037E9144A
MKIFFALSLVLWTAVSSNCEVQKTQSNEFYQVSPLEIVPVRLILATITATDGPIRGEVSVNLYGTIIGNIENYINWYSGNGSIGIKQGGIGYDYVVLEYDIGADGDVYISTTLYTNEGVDMGNIARINNLDIEKQFMHEKESSDQRTIYFSAYGMNFIKTDKARKESYHFNFDREISTCIGTSYWWDGEGNTEVKGGKSENYFEFTSDIPAHVKGNFTYKCSYGTRNSKVPSQNSCQNNHEIYPHAKDNSTYYLYQRYDTITSDISNCISLAPIDVELVHYQGVTEWRNGTGSTNVTRGGVGYDFIEFQYTMDPYAFGLSQYNFTIRTL